ncbi:MAG: phosphopantothenoylcysteine decarboxylase [Candidatus Omnitrophica bacterium]|nr:phosphopantothenoylcysteine decarboxylase [Candidatus Omnitrophota bacterium]
MEKKKRNNIVVGVSASIAAYKACELVSLLKKKGFAVKCVLSRDADKFVTPLTFETLTAEKVGHDMFGLPYERCPEHVSFGEWADLIVIAPATADIIGKIAAGLSDDMLACTVAAARCPVIVAPAMNDRMYTNPILQDKIVYLKSKGYRFVEPVVGELACGRKGIGHLAPVEEILKAAEKALNSEL